jgi:hypothetical protein
MTQNRGVKISDGVQDVDFDVLAEVHSSGGWDWTAEAILQRRSDKTKFYVSEHGCSCNHFLDRTTVADLTPIRTIGDGFRMARNGVLLRNAYSWKRSAHGKH